MDEARHLEVFLRYLETKLERIYKVNDNLFTIIDDLLTDSRWDIKFLGMQIMVEGLALGAFSTMYNQTEEPLLKQLLRYVIQDEARHVHYGVLALREEITNKLSPNERREREDWAFEVAMLMRNRFLAHEIYEEWFEGRMPRRTWNKILSESPAMTKFRSTMFQRLVPNLKYIGLLSDRMQSYYEKAGLLVYADGKNASQLTEADLVRDNDVAAALARRFCESVPHSLDLGIEVVAVGDATASMRLVTAAFQVVDVDRGHILSSVLYSLADACSGLAVFAATKDLTPIATLDMRMDYLRPARIGQTLKAEAHCYCLNPDVVFVRCEISAEDDGTTLAICNAAFMRAVSKRSMAFLS